MGGLRPDDLIGAAAERVRAGAPQVDAQDVGGAANGAQAWLYEFVWKSPQLDGTIGASHLVELPFVFNGLDNPNIAAMLGDNAPQSLADEMHGRWIAFAKNDDPGWPTFDRKNAVSMTFDTTSATETHRHTAELKVWTHD